jgi:two-component system chemotaxis sensor kinase CheA
MTADIDLKLLRETFEAEATDLLASMEEALLGLEDRPGDEELVVTLFRAAHTIKGNARIVGLDHVVEFTHVFEDLLDAIRGREILVDEELVTLLLRAVDALREMISDAVVEGDELAPEHKALQEELAERRPGAPGAEETPAAERSGDEVAGAGDGREGARASARRRKTLRVGIDKLDTIMDLVGEIAIARERVTEMLESDESWSRRETLEVHREADMLYMDLQERVMKVRMVPVEPLFREQIRSVRDLSKASQKQARLVVEADDVEVDTTLVEHLHDPLTHLVRNAVNHGIERSQERVAQGKPPVGKITLRAYHDAGGIVIQVEDDGEGLRRERILERARSMALVAEEETPSDEDLFRLVFSSGLSTVEAVTEISGRGVGMDVVRRNIELLRGSVAIESREGQGTTVTMRLPLTLAIIEGFRVGVGNETFVVPLDTVVECVELPGEARPDEDGRGVIKLRDKPLPFLELRRHFSLGGAAPERENVIVVRYGGLEAGLAVDELYGEGQTVIKPLSKLFQDLPGLGGSAIMGNGSVAFVLDVPGLLREALHDGTELSAACQ